MTISATGKFDFRSTQWLVFASRDRTGEDVVIDNCAIRSRQSADNTTALRDTLNLRREFAGGLKGSKKYVQRERGREGERERGREGERESGREGEREREREGVGEKEKSAP